MNIYTYGSLTIESEIGVVLEIDMISMMDVREVFILNSNWTDEHKKFFKLYLDSVKDCLGTL